MLTLRFYPALIIFECEQNFVINTELELFTPSSSLELVAINILGSLPHTMYINQFMVIITGRYSSPTWAIATTKITSTQVSNIFLNHYVLPYGISDTILSDNGQ